MSDLQAHENPINTPSEIEAEAASAPPRFEQLTLWQTLQLLIYRPGATLSRLWEEIALEPPRPKSEKISGSVFDSKETSRETSSQEADFSPASQTKAVPESAAYDPYFERLRGHESARGLSLNPETMPIFAGLWVALLFALIGGLRLYSVAVGRTTAQPSLRGAPVWFALAGIVYLGVMIWASRAWWAALWRERSLKPKSLSPENERENESLSDEKATNAQNQGRVIERFFAGIEANALRLALLPFGLIFAYLAYAQNVAYRADDVIGDVLFTTGGFIAWVAAIVVWYLILAVDIQSVAGRFYLRLIGQHPRTGERWNLQRLIGEWGGRWALISLILIMGLAAYFRLDDLGGVPPEMTSDHIEKLLDSLRVYEGYSAIFFPNNGGREAFQMYFIALLAELGAGFSFETLKLASIIEGLLTVLLGYGLGVSFMGRATTEDRRMGVWLGLSFAALLAVSSWHVMLSRLGLRIALTPLTTLILLIFLMRAMRHNRRTDYVLMGLTLGLGFYFYQANRMLPIVAVVGVVLAALVGARRWSDLGRYAVNLGATGIMALVIFLPMFHYGQVFPDDFWSRTRGRLFGEEAFVIEENGRRVPYQPSVREQAERFIENASVFEENYRDALYMWHWQGDAAWINNGAARPARPALDPYSGGLLILGLFGWLALFGKKWEAVQLLIPIGILIMLLPSALTLAYQIENPSFTRASGTIPFIYLLAAYPLAQIGYYAAETLRARAWGLALGIMLIAPIIGLAGVNNYSWYFNDYRAEYSASWRPYAAIATPMQNFAQNQGSYGNAFMIAWPHWLDHRILGTVAGDIRWNNGLAQREDLFNRVILNQGTNYAYDSQRPLFFMYNQRDNVTGDWLRTLFPDGAGRTEFIASDPNQSFHIFIAPPNQDWGVLRQRALNFAEGDSGE